MEAPTASRRLRVAGLVLLNVVAAAGVHLAWIGVPSYVGAAQKPAVVATEEDRLIAVIARTSPAVVSILVQKMGPGVQTLNVKADGQVESLPRQDELQEIGKGTGFLVDSDGLIVTNRHVAFERDAVLTVFLSDGQKFHADIIDIDPVNDLALLKIQGKGLPKLELEADDKLKIGQTTIAIGNALGKYANTVTRGILSGIDRDVEASNGITGDVERLDQLLQTDAAINSGNSGGPLLNSDGKVIGIDTAVETGAQSLGFAIPVSEIRKVVDSYHRYGAIARPRLGVRYFTITPEMVIQKNLAYQYGALVGSDDPTEAVVLPGSPAETAGLMKDDIILEMNGRKLEGKWTLARAIQSMTVGDVVRMKVARGGETLMLIAHLDAHPPYAGE